MTPEEARQKIIKEATEGIAYGSRMGDYGSKESFYELITAIRTIRDDLKGVELVDRELFAHLFTIGNQVEGNVHGALAKGLKVPDWLWDEGLVDLIEALYEVFGDY